MFALIALFVGSFIIYNTFSILVAQRGREMALLRAIGASRRQVLGSVLLEAVVVGLIAALLGVAAGIGVAAGLKALLVGFGLLDVPAGGLVLSPRTVLVALLTGVLVSAAAAVLPAHRAAKVPPVAALRDLARDGSGSSRRRVVIGAAVTVAGVASFSLGLLSDSKRAILPAGLGAAAVLIGVAVLGPVIARPVSRLIGAPLPALKGMPGRLARENAVRNPKRTSATAAALMIGVRRLTVAAIFGDKQQVASSYVLGLPAYDANFPDRLDGQVLVKRGAGVEPGAARAAVERVTADYPAARLQDRAEYKRARSAEMDKEFGLVYVLLALAVLIALLGIANTLALSVFERTRELGLLRAVGMARRQVRAMVRWESVIIALLGTCMGLAIGLCFAWAVVKAVPDLGAMTVPVDQLAGSMLAAAVAGVLAAVLPARRAANLDVLGAISAE